MADFNPKDLAKLAASLLQGVAPIVGGLLGGPAGAAIAGAVVPQIAVALGLGADAPPAAVADAVAADPQASDKLAVLEAMYADVQNARQQTIDLAKVGSDIAWGAPVISVLTVIGFFGLLFAMIFKAVPDSQMLSILLGALSGQFAQVGNYWLGSSKGSSDKTAAMTAIIRGK